jgi:hypothetical protein
LYGTIGRCSTKFGPYKIKDYKYTSYETYDCLALLGVVLQRPVTVAITVD